MSRPALFRPALALATLSLAAFATACASSSAGAEGDDTDATEAGPVRDLSDVTSAIEPDAGASNAGAADAAASDDVRPNLDVGGDDADDEGDGSLAPGDAGTRDSGPRDSGSSDSGPRDTGEADAGSSDSGPRDTGQADPEAPDTGRPDVAIRDSGSSDGATPDASDPDGGPDDSGPLDAGSPDGASSGDGTSCDDAIVVSSGAPFAASVAAEDTVGAFCAPSSSGGEAFYSFRAPRAGTYCFDTAGSAASDTVLVIGSGCGVDDVQLNCVDDVDGELQASASHYLGAGETVFAVVSPYSGNADVRLAVNEGACPGTEGFETCAHPFVVNAFDTFAGPAFADDASGSCSAAFSASNEAVIAFEAPETGITCVQLSGTDDVVLYARSSCHPDDEIACVDARASGPEQLELSTIAGETYFLFLEDYATSAFETPLFEYTVSSGPCP